jgi:hypothetical protein
MTKAFRGRMLHTHQRKNPPKGMFQFSIPMLPKQENTHLLFINVETLIKFKSHTNPHTLIVEDFNIPLLSMYRSPTHNLNSKIVKLKDAMNQIYLTDIYRTFNPNTNVYTFFLASNGTFSKIDFVRK